MFLSLCVIYLVQKVFAGRTITVCGRMRPACQCLDHAELTLIIDRSRQAGSVNNYFGSTLKVPLVFDKRQYHVTYIDINFFACFVHQSYTRYFTEKKAPNNYEHAIFRNSHF